jgi:hypothetical protein
LDPETDPVTPIGPVTEQLLRETFAERALAPACDAARVLGLDEKTFASLVDSGAVRHVKVSPKTKRYAEHDLRAFLTGETRLPEGPDRKNRETAPCRSTSQSARRTGTTTSSDKVVGFTAQRARRLAEQRKPSKPSSGGPRA